MNHGIYSNNMTPNNVECSEVGMNDVEESTNSSNVDRISLSVYFVHLHGHKTVLEQRLKQRKGHFMSPGLLESQLNTLEALTDGEEGFVVDIEKSPVDIVSEIKKNLGVAV